MTDYLPRIVSFVSLRGPCGKTALACGLGALLAGSGKRIALIDLDPKLSATARLLDRTMWDQTIMDVIGEPDASGKIPSAFQPTGWPNLWVLPGSGELGRIDRVMVGRAVEAIQRELGGEAISAILIDTPPASGPLLAKVIELSDLVLLPFAPAMGSLFAARNAVQAILEYSAERAPRPFGLVPSGMRAEDSAHTAFLRAMETFLSSAGGFSGIARMLPAFPFLTELLEPPEGYPSGSSYMFPVPLPAAAEPPLREIALAAGLLP